VAVTRTRLSLLRRARSAASDAFVAMAAKATQGGAMAVGALFVIWKGSPTVQGFYFAFISFAVMLQLCDFGLSYASLQAASHLRASGRGASIGGLVARTLRVNARVTAVAALVVAAIGWALFDREGSDVVAWKTVWFSFIVLVTCVQWTGPYVFLVEGAMSVTRAWRFRLWQEVVAGLVLLVLLASGHELWALCGYYAARLVLTLGFIARVRLPFDRRATDAWPRELWSFQWRVGVGAISGFLAFQAFGPILFALQGPEYAGRFALSLSLMNAVVMVTTAWPISQAAHFGALASPGREAQLYRLWQSVLWRSSAFAFVASLALMGVLLVVDHVQPRVIARFDVMSATLLLVACAIVHHVIACFTVLLRAERRDPMLVPNVVGGLVGVALMSLAAMQSGTTMIAFVYLLWMIVLLAIAWSRYQRFAIRHFAHVR